MNYWIFTVTQKKVDGETIAASDILKQRISDQFWGLGEKTPNRRSLKKGDHVVFYVGLPQKTFAASATLDSDSFELDEATRQQLAHGKKRFTTDFGVYLTDISVWSTPRPVEQLVPDLTFIENKESWFSYFQGGVRQISDLDFRTITLVRTSSQTQSPFSQSDFANQSTFALEAHLEEFIDKNWTSINFGSDLVQYEIEDQTGRQFPAGPWSIDFLCVDKLTDDFVIIELKRGKTSDSTVGQVLRYIGWVEENLAKPQQNVRGIIIASEVDDALRYAVKGLSNIAVLTYRVDFSLSTFMK